MPGILDDNLNFNQFNEIDAIALLIDPTTGKIDDANIAAEKFYGYSRERLCTMRIQTINQLSDEEIGREMIKAEIKHKNYFSFKHQIKSGEIKNVEVYSGPITIKDKKYLFSIIYEIKGDEFKIGDIKDRIKNMEVVVICSHCHRIRDENRWIPSQIFLEDKIYYKSHSICDYCLKENYPEFVDKLA
jgi:PAS domain S-box-containing protein